MKLELLYIILLIYSSCTYKTNINKQKDEESDAYYIKENYFKTSHVYHTQSQINCSNKYGIYFDSLSGKIIAEDLFSQRYDSIVGIFHQNNSIKIDVYAIACCSKNYLADIQMLNDGILNLVYVAYPNYLGSCCCDCLTNLKFYLRSKFDVPLIKYVMINSEKNTLTRFVK